MRLAWRNKLAYALLGVALLQYMLTGFELLPSLSALRAQLPVSQQIQLLVGWLTGPVTIIAWAAVVEYLSRISNAMERRAGQV